MNDCGICGEPDKAFVVHDCKPNLEQSSNVPRVIGLTNECIHWLEQRITALEEKLSRGTRKGS